MEQSRYWMWSTKRKPDFNLVLQAPNVNPPYDDSWEEQAFAEDAVAGTLGECIWPPRSYTCSFCRREFMSAQALGGHMNVHRRDRARLKQSSSPTYNNEIIPLLDHQNPHMGFGKSSSQILDVVYNSPPPNPNFESSPWVSSTTRENRCCEKSFFPAVSSHDLEEQHKSSLIFSPPLPRTSLDSSHRCHQDHQKSEGENDSRILESTGCTTTRAKVVDCVTTDLSVSLNLVVRRTRTAALSDSEGKEDLSCKRRRTNASTLPFSLNSSDIHHFQSEVLAISPCSIEELDLELRLGDRPKVK